MSARAEDFHGVWQLARWSVTVGDGTERLPFAGDVDGHIIYSPEGWMSATLMERGRAAFSEDRFALNSLKRAFRDDPDYAPSGLEQTVLRDFYLASQGYIAYTGPFDWDERCVHHRVRVSLVPQWIGTTLTRAYVFEADGRRLTLSAEQGDFVDQLIWERVPEQP